MDPMGVLFTAGILLVSAAVGFVFSRKANQAWAAAGQELGLFYSHGSVFSERLLEGKVDGLEVRVETFVKEGSGEGSRRFTRIVVDGHGGFPPEITLRAENALLGLRKVVTGEDVLVGDEEFDERVHVEGPEELALAVLNAPARRAVEIALASGCTVELGDVCCEERGVYRSAAPLVVQVRGMVSAAKYLSVGPIPKGLGANAVHDPLPAVRLRSLELLVKKFSASPEAPTALGAALEDSDPSVRFFAASRSRTARARRVLETFPADQAAGEERRGEALDRLVELFGYDAVASEVASSLSSSCAPLCRAAVRAAGAARDALLLGAIAAHARAEDPALGEAVAKALGELGGPHAEQTLLSLLSHDSVGVQRAAIRGLGLAGSVRSVEALLARSTGALRDEARDSVRQIQGRLGDAEAGRLSLAENVAAAGAVSVVEAGEAAVISPERLRS